MKYRFAPSSQRGKFMFNLNIPKRLLGAYRMFSTELLLHPPFTRCLPSVFNGNIASSTVYQVLTEWSKRKSCFLHRLLGAYRMFATELLLPPPFTGCSHSVFYGSTASSTVYQVLTEWFKRKSCFLHHLLVADRTFAAEFLLPPPFTRCLPSASNGNIASPTVYYVLTECFQGKSCFLNRSLDAYRMFSTDLLLPSTVTRCLPNIFYGTFASSTT